MYNFAAYQPRKARAIAFGFGTLDEFIAELKGRGFRRFAIYTRTGQKPVYEQ
jgi:hypothetical protein